MLPYFFTFPGKRGEWRCGEWWKIRFATHPSSPFHLGWTAVAVQRKRAIFYFPPFPSPLHPSSPARYFLIQRGGNSLRRNRKEKGKLGCAEYTTSGYREGGGVLFPVSLTNVVAPFRSSVQPTCFPIFSCTRNGIFFREKYGLIYVWVPFFSWSCRFHHHTHRTSSSPPKKNIRKPSPFALPFFALF